MGSAVNAAPTFDFATGDIVTAQCNGAASPVSILTAIPKGLDPNRRYEILITRSAQDLLGRRRNVGIEASASIYTGRQRRVSYVLEDIWPGEYDAIMIDKDAPVSHGRGALVASKRLLIAPPPSSFTYPQNLNPSQPFTLVAKSGAGLNRRRLLALSVSPIAPSGASGSPAHLRIANISPCSTTDIPMKGLPPGRYYVRLIQSLGGADDTILHQVTLAVGTQARQAEAASVAVSSPARAELPNALKASTTNPSITGSSWNTGAAGLVKINPFTNRANATPAQIKGAEDYWVYAALSNNVYRQERSIELPSDWELYDVKNIDFGFYAETHFRRHDGKIVEVVVAFRGSEERSDWWSGNLPPLTSPQQAIAKDYAQKIMALDAFSGVKFTATGHSLGGALAKVAVNGTNNTAVVFNSSPRGPDTANVVYFEEVGDGLDLLRMADDGAIQYDFTHVGPQESHRIFSLAIGMKNLAE